MKLSVLLTTYNHEKFIAEAINSVLAQEVNFEYEVIIMEDCSTDSTRNIVVDFQRRYPNKICLLLSEQNLNSIKFFVQGLQASQGQYVALLDGDDYWTSPQKLQKQADFLDNHPECAICFHNAEVFYEDGSRESWNYNPTNQKEISTIEDLWVRNFIATCSVMFRKDLVDKLPNWYYDAQYGDWELHIINAQYGKIGYINEVMGKYRIHSGGIWSSLEEGQMLKSYIRFYETMNANLKFRYEKNIRPILSEQCYMLAGIYEKAGDSHEAKTYALRYFFERPITKWLDSRKPFGMLLRLYTPRLYNFMKHLSGVFT